MEDAVYSNHMDPSIIFLGVVIVIFSIILHEVAHGFAANLLGDPTARLAGRLTLNPLPHIDPVGSVLLPAILVLSGTPFLVGWAKPVPYNPYNLRGGKWGEAFVSFAGPLTNIIIAILGAIFIRLGAFGSAELFQVAVIVVIANIVLALINMIPIPPLDGSKVLRALLPLSAGELFSRLERFTYMLGPFGLIAVLLLLVFVFSDFIYAFVGAIFSLLTGIGL